MTGRRAGAFVRSRHAGLGRAFGSVTMAVYVIVLLTIFLAPLLVNALVLALASATLTPFLTVAEAASPVALAASLAPWCGFTVVVAALVGRIRGPIAVGQLEAAIRLMSPDRRSSAFAPTAWRAFVTVAAGGAVIAASLGCAGVIGRGWSLPAAAALGIAGVVLAAAAADAWLLGQARIRGWTEALTLGVVALSLAAVRWDPAGLILLAVLALLALATPLLIPFCLDRMPSAVISRHSALAEVAATLTRTGDFSAAVREYRPNPSRGRTWRVLGRRATSARLDGSRAGGTGGTATTHPVRPRAGGFLRSPWSILRGAARTRGRVESGLALIVLGTGVLSVGLAIAGHAGAVGGVRAGGGGGAGTGVEAGTGACGADWGGIASALGHLGPVPVGIICAIGLISTYAGIGSFTDSLESAADTASAVSLHRLTPYQLLLRAGASVTVLVIVIASALIALWVAALDPVLGCSGGAGCGIACGAGDPTAASLTTTGTSAAALQLCAVTLAVLIHLCAAKVFTATKGPLPAGLTMPVSTPAGDPSVILMALWQFDAVIVGPLAAGAVAALSMTDPRWALASPLIAAALLWGARRRLAT